MISTKAPKTPRERYAEAYRAFLAARPTHGELIPEVAAMVDAGKLSEIDGEWIARLKPESQLAAAKKCCKPTFIIVATGRFDRSTITCGTPRSMGEAS